MIFDVKYSKYKINPSWGYSCNDYYNAKQLPATTKLYKIFHLNETRTYYYGIHPLWLAGINMFNVTIVTVYIIQVLSHAYMHLF